MYCESFHRLLKVVYLENRQNCRVDHMVLILLRISRDKAFGRLCKIEKGEYSHRSSGIVKRHSNACEMVSKGVVPMQCPDIS